MEPKVANIDGSTVFVCSEIIPRSIKCNIVFLAFEDPSAFIFRAPVVHGK
jgi:hypothetical protein